VHKAVSICIFYNRLAEVGAAEEHFGPREGAGLGWEAGAVSVCDGQYFTRSKAASKAALRTHMSKLISFRVTNIQFWKVEDNEKKMKVRSGLSTSFT
jgi:hypothetical protein